MKKKIINTSICIFIFILFLLLPNYLIDKIGNFNYIYVIEPLFYIFFSIFFLIMSRKKNITNFNRSSIRQIAIIGSILYLLLYYLDGLGIGFSNSPYNHSLMGIFKNLYLYLIIAISHEIIRDHFIKKDGDKSKYYTVLITIILTLVSVGFANYNITISSSKQLLDYLFEFIFPSIIMNIFLSYLVYREGLFSALIYKIPFLIIYILTPILPYNNFPILCVIKAIPPLVVYLKIEKEYFSSIVLSVKRSFMGFEKIRLLIFVITLIFILSFTTGRLLYKPVVILTGSMNPVLEKGDIVVYNKIEFNDIKVNDIIVYSLGEISVIHRVHKITYQDNKQVLITKGDNNNSIDVSPVSEDQVLGKVLFKVKKIGYPTIWVNELLNGVSKSVGVETRN